MKLVDLERLMEACPGGGPKEFRGTAEAVRRVMELMASGQCRIPAVKPYEVLGFPVIEDPTCPPGFLYFGRREDFERGKESLGDPGCPRCKGTGILWAPVMATLCSCAVNRLINAPVRWWDGPPAIAVDGRTSTVLGGIDRVVEAAEEE